MKKKSQALVSEETQCQPNIVESPGSPNEHSKRPPIPIPSNIPKISQNLHLTQPKKKSKKHFHSPSRYENSPKTEKNNKTENDRIKKANDKDNSKNEHSKQKNHRKSKDIEINEYDIIDVIIQTEILEELPLEINRNEYMSQAVAHQNVKMLIREQQQKLFNKKQTRFGHTMISTSNSSDDESLGSERIHNSSQELFRTSFKSRENSLRNLNAILSIDDIAKYNSDSSSTNESNAIKSIFYNAPTDEVTEIDELLTFEIIEPFKFDLFDFSDPTYKKMSVDLRPKPK
ncbi:hypothetical protein TRFO_00915 [Tritrichomonas foetus]|uniref:Uncharacterized protein n=1 Tax=Tritrichomonas foetus TaxID=1144522 RepID=A0A1J4L2A0_9EUKA|nr:hypothetical protein TRFO_00915 [Tritrichomonas foetus]|eukprot:OHT17641.1 hypothetical protein TRFO_00915 [Tritrichomonas foetus]